MFAITTRASTSVKSTFCNSSISYVAHTFDSAVPSRNSTGTISQFGFGLMPGLQDQEVADLLPDDLWAHRRH